MIRRLTWVGHATVFIELDGARVLTDPVIRPRMGPLVRVVPPPSEDDLTSIDAVLLSHLHYDHVDLPSLARIGHATPVLAPRGAGRWLESHGLREVAEVEVGAEANIGSLRVTATPALHDGRRRPFGVKADAIGFTIQGSSTVYFAGDTDLFPGMADLAGSIDVALLPVWGWGRALGPGHLDPDRAAAAAAMVRPDLVVPIHWGTLAPWPRMLRLSDAGRPAREFAACVARRAPRVEVRVLAPGEATALPTHTGVGAR